MAAGKHNITIEEGSTFSQRWTYKDVNGNPIDLTGYTARMQVREKHSSSTAVIDISDGNGITLGGAAGTIDIEILPAATINLALPKGFGVYDMELTPPDGKTFRLMEGGVKYTREVTR